jgi:hypothetical protein
MEKYIYREREREYGAHQAAGSKQLLNGIETEQ